MNTLFAAAMLAGMFLAGVGLWALGKWLRNRGHGDRLDKINAKMSKCQQLAGGVLGPLSGGFFSIARSVSRAPLLGNRRSREMWNDLEELARQHRKDRT